MAHTRVLFAFFPIVLMIGCGANRQMQSISISPAVGTGANATFTATGNFNMNPTRISPVPVSWYLLPEVDPPPASYSLSSGPYVATRCPPNLSLPATFTIIALAPADPGAPSSGKVPAQVMSDLVLMHTTSAEGGFVAATAKLICQ